MTGNGVLLTALLALLVGLALGKAWERYKLREGRWVDRRRLRESPHFIQGLNCLVAGQVDQAIVDLAVTGAPAGQISTAVTTGLRDLDACHNHLLVQRARVGEALNRMDQVEVRNGDARLAAETERSNAEDLDMVAAISDFQGRQTGYDAALKAYSLVQRMTLFNYIGG